MKRTLKNILMTILVLGLCALVYVTIELAKGNISLTANKVISLEASVIKFNEENEQAGAEESSVSDPDSSTEEITTEVIDDGTGEVVTTTSEETTDPDTTVTNEDDVLYTTTSTDDTDENLAAENGLVDKSLTTEKKDVSIVYYIAIAVESLFISLLLSYLAYSKFNKFTFKEVFSVKKMAIYYILFSLILAFSIAIMLFDYLN